MHAQEHIQINDKLTVELSSFLGKLRCIENHRCQVSLINGPIRIKYVGLPVEKILSLWIFWVNDLVNSYGGTFSNMVTDMQNSIVG